MKAEHNESTSQNPDAGFLVMMALCCLAVAAYFLLLKDTLNLGSLFPILILLACPMMHLFMHRRRVPGRCTT